MEGGRLLLGMVLSSTRGECRTDKHRIDDGDSHIEFNRNICIGSGAYMVYCVGVVFSISEYP